MRYIIYWLFYTGSFCGERQISGVVIVTDSTVTSYICPYEYLEWKIVEKTQVVQDDQLIEGNYLLDYKGYKSYLVIDKKQIYHYIGNGDQLYLKRNDRKTHQQVDDGKKKTTRRISK